jgi:hypothetical protein
MGVMDLLGNTGMLSQMGMTYGRGNSRLIQSLAQQAKTGDSSGLPSGITNGYSGLSNFANKTQTYPAPEWDNFLTKRKAEMTDEKYAEAIREQAKKDREAGTYQKSEKFNSLKQSYVSVASPDRKGIIEKTNGAIANGSLMNSIANYGQYKDETGKTVAMYGQKTGWMMLNTAEENKRSTEFMEIYNAAYYGTDKATAKAPTEEGGLDVEA